MLSHGGYQTTSELQAGAFAVLFEDEELISKLLADAKLHLLGEHLFLLLTF